MKIKHILINDQEDVLFFNFKHIDGKLLQKLYTPSKIEIETCVFPRYRLRTKTIPTLHSPYIYVHNLARPSLATFV